jgi:hypothetical protein
LFLLHRREIRQSAREEPAQDKRDENTHRELKNRTPALLPVMLKPERV